MVRLEFRHIECDVFKAEPRHVERHGDYWLIHPQSDPHVVAHVQLSKTEVEYANIHTPEKIRCRVSDFIYHNGEGTTIEEEGHHR